MCHAGMREGKILSTFMSKSNNAHGIAAEPHSLYVVLSGSGYKHT